MQRSSSMAMVSYARLCSRAKDSVEVCQSGLPVNLACKAGIKDGQGRAGPGGATVWAGLVRSGVGGRE